MLAMAAGLGAPALATTGASGQEAAAEKPDAGYEEIIVTAQRRAERLQDLPLSVTVFSGDTLEKLSTERAGDALAFVPNVGLTSGPSGGDDANIFIRGVGQVDNSVAVDPGVAMYVDDVYIGRLQAASVDLLDIERLEVLRGPQGTLFGRNAIGGAVNVITSDPGDEVETTLRVTAGSRDRLDARGTVSGPLTDALSVSMAVSSRNQKGWGENVYTGATYGDVQDIGGRVKFVFEPNPDFTARLALDYTKGMGSPASQVLLGTQGTTSSLRIAFPTGASSEVTDDPEANYSSAPPINDTENMGASFTAEWKLNPNVAIKSITAARAYDETTYNDYDGTSYAIYDNFFDVDQEQYSQELQFFGTAFSNRLDWLGGLYGYQENIVSDTQLCLGSLGPQFSTNCIRSDNYLGLDIQSIAAFGHATFAVTDRLKLIAGLRWTLEEKTQTFASRFVNNLGQTYCLFITLGQCPPNLGGANNPLNLTVGEGYTTLAYTEVNDDYEATTPKVGLEYRVGPSLLVYGTYSEGFKSGGFSGRATSADITSYRPETLQTFEIGWKSDWFDRRARFNGAVFTSEYQDIQFLVLNDNNQYDTLNVGDAEISGAELEFSVRPVAALSLYVNAGYLDAGYTSISYDDAVYNLNVDVDNELPLSPEWTFSAGAGYVWSIAAGELEVRADYAWRDDVFFQVENEPLERQEAYGLLNARATYTTARDLAISVFGVNVTDEKYLTNATQGSNVAFGGYGAPAEYGVELAVKF